MVLSLLTVQHPHWPAGGKRQAKVVTRRAAKAAATRLVGMSSTEQNRSKVHMAECLILVADLCCLRVLMFQGVMHVKRCALQI